MTDTGTNALGTGYGNAVTNGAVLQQYEPASDLPIGSVVDVEDYAGPGTGARSAVPEIVPSSTSADGMTIGVVVTGDITGTGTVPAGVVATVLVLGIGLVLCDATTVAGEVLVQSPSLAGAARTAASPATRAIGIALQSVTISSGTKLVWCIVAPGTQPLAGGGGGAVSSVFGRAGNVVAEGTDYASFYDALGAAAAAQAAAEAASDPVGSAAAAQAAAEAASDPVGSAAAAQAAAEAASDPVGSAAAAQAAAEAASDPVGSAAAAQAAAEAASDPVGSAATAQTTAIATAATNANLALYANPVIRSALN